MYLDKTNSNTLLALTLSLTSSVLIGCSTDSSTTEPVAENFIITADPTSESSMMNDTDVQAESGDVNTSGDADLMSESENLPSPEVMDESELMSESEVIDEPELLSEPEPTDETEAMTKTVALPISVNPDTGDVGNGGAEFALRNRHGLGLSGDGRYAFYARSETDGWVIAGVATTVYRYRISDGHVEQVIENRNRTSQDLIDISHDGESVIYAFRGQTLLARSVNGFAATSLAELVGIDAKIDGARFSKDGVTVVFRATITDDDTSIQRYYFYNLETETFEQTNALSIPNPGNQYQEYNWMPGALLDINGDGNVVLLRAELELLNGTANEIQAASRNQAYMVFNRSEDTSYAITKYQRNPSSTPATSGFFRPKADPLLSDTGDVVVFAALPEVEDQNTTRQYELYRYEYLEDEEALYIEAADNLDYLAIDSAANIISWKVSSTYGFYHVQSGEHVPLTTNGYSNCGRACSRGNSEFLGPRVARDGSRIVYGEYVPSTDADDLGGQMDSTLLKTYEVASESVTDSMNISDDQSSRDLEISEFDIASNGETIVVETTVYRVDAERPQSVVLLQQ